MSLHIGEDIGDYRIVSIIGAGSMGQVFQVEHRYTKRREALKVLVGDCATESQIQRFEREIETQARLDHPNIARVHNALLLNGSQMLVMELVEGESLEKKLRQGQVSGTAGIDYICQTLSALEYAHSQGVVHRDVTPGNLIIDHNGNVKLTDFGVAKSLGDYQLTSAGEIVGSLYYMPPEQVRRHAEPDPRSDIYSTGAVLYEVLTGKKLFDCADRLSLMVAQVQQQPIPPIEINPAIGPELNAVLLKALVKDPAERHQSAKEFLVALQPFAIEAIRPAPAPVQPVARTRFFARVPLGAVALAAFALISPGGTHKSGGTHKTGVDTISFHPATPLPSKLEAPAPLAVPVATSSSHLKVAAISRPRRPISHARTAEEPANAVPDETDPASPDVETTASTEETITAPEDATETTTEPVAASDQQAASPARHKRFWSILNPFKRKKAEPEIQNSFTKQ
jgi:eukaryotic-like serine/threonine-protein kinase